MSNRARLLLVSGVGGAGTSSACAATLAALTDEGVRARLVDGERMHAEPVALDLLSASLGRLAGDLGAEPMVHQAWDSLPGIGLLSTLHAALEALQDPGVQAVVVDCGDLRRARELVELPAVLVRLLDAALTPRLAMWRAAGRQPGPIEGDTAFESLSRARGELLRLQRMLEHPTTTMRLVTLAQDWAVSRTLHAAAVFPLLGVGVDGIIVNRFPRKADGWPKPDVAAHSAQLERLCEGSDGVEVWRSTGAVRAAPKGRSAMGPLGRVHVLDVDEITVRAGDEEYTLDLPLVGEALAQAAVGRLGDDLVVRFGDVHRWLPLPPLLRRCRATSAVRTPHGLRVGFVPDASLWRTDAEVAS